MIYSGIQPRSLRYITGKAPKSYLVGKNNRRHWIGSSSTGGFISLLHLWWNILFLGSWKAGAFQAGFIPLISVREIAIRLRTGNLHTRLPTTLCTAAVVHSPTFEILNLLPSNEESMPSHNLQADFWESDGWKLACGPLIPIKLNVMTVPLVHLVRWIINPDADAAYLTNISMATPVISWYHYWCHAGSSRSFRTFRCGFTLNVVPRRDTVLSVSSGFVTVCLFHLDKLLPKYHFDRKDTLCCWWHFRRIVDAASTKHFAPMPGHHNFCLASDISMVRVMCLFHGINVSGDTEFFPL